MELLVWRLVNLWFTRFCPTSLLRIAWYQIELHVWRLIHTGGGTFRVHNQWSVLELFCSIFQSFGPKFPCLGFFYEHTKDNIQRVQDYPNLVLLRWIWNVDAPVVVTFSLSSANNLRLIENECVGKRRCHHCYWQSFAILTGMEKWPFFIF